jgi:hypothetical protein
MTEGGFLPIFALSAAKFSFASSTVDKQLCKQQRRVHC